MLRLTAGAAALLAAAVALAACGPSSATTAPTQAAIATEPPAATQAPVTTLPPLPSVGALPSVDLPSEDQELEDMLPDTVGTTPVSKLSMTGESLIAAGGQEALESVLGQFNKQPSDLGVAIGGAGNVGLFAYRIKGVDATQFFQSFVAAAQGEDPAVTVTDETLGGKSVKKVVTSDETLYIYAKGDVLFGVSGSGATEAELAEAIALLP